MLSDPPSELHVRPLRAGELDRLAAFLARLNVQPEHHVGYCGVDESELLHALQDSDEAPIQEAFVLAERGGQLVGALGFDADLETGHLELWGPFAEGENRRAVADHLWSALTLPPEAARLELFCNAENTLCTDFALRHGFVEGPQAQILETLTLRPGRCSSPAISTLLSPFTTRSSQAPTIQGRQF